MKTKFLSLISVAAIMLGLTGCAHVSENTRAYLGSPKYAPTEATKVVVLQTEPKEPHERLGEVLLEATSNVSRDELENRLRQAAAKLGADAVFLAYDRMHVTPIVYADWWGPSTVGRDLRRNIVGIAIKYK